VNECAPEFKPECEVSIGDFVWSDTDGDGCQGANEPGIGGVGVNLIDCSVQGVIASSATAADGSYGFTVSAVDENCRPATRNLALAVELDNFTLQDQEMCVPGDPAASDALDSDCDETGLTVCTEYPAGTNDDTVDCGQTVAVPVAFDIKPGSCPNPLNVKSKGVLPAAIMGYEGFDVTQIDPASLELALKNGDANGGVIPLRWATADVGEPYMPFTGKEDCELDCAGCSCPDEIMDLLLNFDRQELVAYLESLGEVADGNCIVLQITGNLLEEFGGTPIYGEDVLLILKKGK